MGASPARGSDQMDLRPLVPDDDADADAEPTSTSQSPTPATGTWRVKWFSLLTVSESFVSLERTRRLLIASFAGGLVVVFAFLLLAFLLSRVLDARDFDGSLITRPPSDKTNGAKLWATALAKKVQVLNETCERHCARKRGEFGCLLGASSTIGAFATRPLNSEQSATGCRCLHISLLCDRKAKCRNGSDERPDTCAHWNASTKHHRSRIASNARPPCVLHSEDSALRRTRRLRRPER